MSSTTIEDQLVKYLTDAHAIEEQALPQMRAAPRIAKDERLAQVFRDHHAETERHERLVREPFEAQGRGSAHRGRQLERILRGPA
jgi:ferritin-like metal-binding protein YciE